MQLEIIRRMTAGVAVLDVIGQVTAGAEADALRDNLMDALHHSSKYILLNCEQLTKADSSALGEMMQAYSNIVKVGGMLKLLRPQPRFCHLLEMTNLDSVFEVHEDERKAAASFSFSSVAKTQQTMNSFLKGQ
jgi:anti-sigma B factor antagonist